MEVEGVIENFAVNILMKALMYNLTAGCCVNIDHRPGFQLTLLMMNNYGVSV